MTPLVAHIDGVSLWSPQLPGWEAARAAFELGRVPESPPLAVPPPAQLPPAERRRAPQTVSLALATAGEAVQDSGHDPARLLAVFASAHGDLPVIDEVCRTLVQTPLLVSPTRFLHSIHKAPAGFWSLLSHNRRSNTAVCVAGHSFAQGLFEALVQCEAEQSPVLFVAYDTAAVGALTHTTRSEGALSVALVLSPQSGPNSLARIAWSAQAGLVDAPGASTPAGRNLHANAMAPAVPLFEDLAQRQTAPRAWPMSDQQALHLQLQF